MFWVVRWIDAKSDRDMAMVVAAPSRADAEAFASQRHIPFLFVARASQADIADARKAQPEDPFRSPRRRLPSTRYTCLGRPLGRPQLAALLICGVATALLHLRPILPAIVT